MIGDEGRLILREALNVEDLKQRDALILRIKQIRAAAESELHTIQHWNEKNPDEQPFDVRYYVAVIDWCDGKIPLPDVTEYPL